MADVIDDSPQAVCRRRYKALRNEGYNHEFCNFAKVAADRIDALEAERDELQKANLEWALSDAKTRSGWFMQKTREQRTRIAALEAEMREYVAYFDSDTDGGDGLFEERMERFAKKFRAALNSSASETEAHK